MAKKCVGLSPQSIEWCDGEINMPGIRADVYYIPKRDIVKWPTLPKTYANSMSELAIYVGDFELAEDKKWQVMQVVVDRSPFTSESQGAKPSKTILNNITFLHPGVEEEATAFCRLANNDDYVYIFRTKPGKYRVIGNDGYQTETNPAMALGAAATDEMGTSVVVSCTDVCPAPFYVGTIETVNGDIDAAA